MGGKSSSKTSQSTTNNVDNRVFNIEGSSGNNFSDIDAGGDVIYTDFDSVSKALDLGESVVDTLADFGSDVIENQTQANSSNLETLKQFATDLQTQGQLELSKTMKTVVLAVVGMTGFVMFTRRGR